MLRLRRRERLRRKEVEGIAERLLSAFGAVTFAVDAAVERAEVSDGLAALLLGEEILALELRGVPVLSVRGLLKWPATKRWVTVDMGAVPYVYNGADVMAPGIVEADPAIAVGDLVWVRDEKNRRPLAVGAALMTGAEMAAAEKGKSVKAVHHVGDEYWTHGHEEPEKPAPDEAEKA